MTLPQNDCLILHWDGKRQARLQMDGSFRLSQREGRRLDWGAAQFRAIAGPLSTKKFEQGEHQIPVAAVNCARSMRRPDC